MSNYSNDNWLALKHRTQPACFYSFSCGDHDSDWDFLDNRSYSFASSETPIQLLNNTGGMDEDDVDIKDVWYPYQDAAAPAIANSDTSGDDDMDMDMEMEMEIDTTPHQATEQRQPQQQPTVSSPNTTLNKRKRGAESLEMNAGLSTYEYQQLAAFDGSKRVRIGA